MNKNTSTYTDIEKDFGVQSLIATGPIITCMILRNRDTQIPNMIILEMDITCIEGPKNLRKQATNEGLLRKDRFLKLCIRGTENVAHFCKKVWPIVNFGTLVNTKAPVTIEGGSPHAYTITKLDERDGTERTTEYCRMVAYQISYQGRLIPCFPTKRNAAGITNPFDIHSTTPTTPTYEDELAEQFSELV